MVVIIGAGPIGLAMAVRLMLKSIPFVVIEKGSSVGWNMIDWGHINLFTSWNQSIDPVSSLLLKQKGFDFSIISKAPTGKAYAKDYLSKVAELIPSENLLLNSEVKNVAYHPTTEIFEIVYSKDEKSILISCKTVFDASGTWGNFKNITQDQHLYSNCIHSIIPDLKFINRLPGNARIAVVGSGHSAMNSLIELASHSQHKLYWLVRGETAKFGKSKVGGKSEALENQVANLIKNKRIKLTTSFGIESIVANKDGLLLRSSSHKEEKSVTHIISNIGTFPDYSLISGFVPKLDKALLTAPSLISKIDPLLHSCDTVFYDFEDTLVTDIPFYVIGMKSFGKASNFLLSKGYNVLDQLMIFLNNY